MSLDSNNGWVCCTLGDIVTFKRGYDLPKDKMNGGKYPVIGSSGIIGFHDEYTTDSPGITIGRSGHGVGRVFIINEPSWSHNTTLFIQKFKNVYPLFIYYLLKNMNLKEYSGGSAIPTLNRNHIHPIDIIIPNDINEQKNIANLLYLLDMKIKLNKKINKNLEDTIKLIFKYYFIDFIPFEDNLIEGIPNDWKHLNLGDVVSDSNTGADAIKKAPIVDYDTGIKCVRVGDMTNSRRIEEWAFSEVNEENYQKYQLKKNDIIVTRTATLGLNIIITENLNAVYNNGLIRIKVDKAKVHPLFIYYYLNTSDYTHYIDCIEGESSTRPNMKINYLLKYPIICPPLKIQNEFINIVSSLFDLKEKLFYEIVKLTNLRDTLLPKLMSGEIDVSKINCDL